MRRGVRRVRARVGGLATRTRVLGIVALALATTACLPPPPPTPPPPTPPTAGAVTIMGPSELTAQQIADYVCEVDRCTPKSTGGTWKPEITPIEMAQLFIDEGNAVGVRGDIAFCQSVLETGWFSWPSSPWSETPAADNGSWPGYVQALDHNYAGIGAFGGSTRYMRKPTPWQGVRAHLQHLRNYADNTSLHSNLGNPFESRLMYGPAEFDTFVYKGQAPTWIQLNGKWAVPGTTYGQNILRICSEMRAFNGLPRLPDALDSSGVSSLDATTVEDQHHELLAETTDRN